MSNDPHESTTTATPTRPWWRRKRWIAVGLIWLGITYLLSSGPARYAEARGWLSSPTVMAYNRPGWLLVWRVPYLPDVYFPYREWWYQRGYRFRIHEGGFSGPGGKFALRYRGVELDGIGFKSWDDEDGVVRRNSYVSFVGHKLVIENGHQLPDRTWKWDGPVLWDGKPVAELPAGTRNVAIEYIDGELAIEADGVEIDVRP